MNREQIATAIFVSFIFLAVLILIKFNKKINKSKGRNEILYNGGQGLILLTIVFILMVVGLVSTSLIK